jgi:endoglucanase
VRACDTEHAIVVPGPGRCGAADLAAMQPLEGDRIVYAFHFYYPMTFTLQGAPWSGAEHALLRAVPYPADPAWIASLTRHLDAAWAPPRELPRDPGALDPAAAESLRRHFAWQKARRALRDYAAAGCDRDHLARHMEPALAWAREHRVPLYCSQFGVHRPFTPPDSRARWLADVISLLESAGVGWAAWEYDGHFGLFVSAEDNSRTLDDPLRSALLLQPHLQPSGSP